MSTKIRKSCVRSRRIRTPHPFPKMHKLVFRWTHKFVTHPWDLGAQDVGELRSAGLSDREITQWAVRASSQSWFTMCADGAGVELDGGISAGPAVGRERSLYESDCRPAMRHKGNAAGVASERKSKAAWVESEEQSQAFNDIKGRAIARWGACPNILTATSALPDTLARHFYMLELLEGPQSTSLPAGTHARIRAESRAPQSLELGHTNDRCAATKSPGRGRLDR